MRAAAFLLLLVTSFAAQAQVYRWVDEKGTIQYSNAAPPPGVKATKLDIEAKPGAPAPDTAECYTVRCQGERMEERLARREALDAQDRAVRAATAPPQFRGLDFRRYISIQRGMSEGELLGIAGVPDLRSRDHFFSSDAYTYMPTVADPFTTTITLIRGRVSEIERVRKF
jgi:hypothetical protein